MCFLSSSSVVAVVVVVVVIVDMETAELGIIKYPTMMNNRQSL
jgi:hypothetical protein